MKATSILSEAINVLRERGKERDQEGERSMARAVEIFNEIDTSTHMDEEAGWKFMIALKLARAGRSDNPDHYIDLAGYIALLGEHVLEANEMISEKLFDTVRDNQWPTHTCCNCGKTYVVSPSSQHCPSCSTHVTYTPL